MHVGVNDKTIAKYRAKLESTSQIAKSDERTGRDGRTINTANIGATAPVPSSDSSDDDSWPDEKSTEDYMSDWNKPVEAFAKSITAIADTAPAGGWWRSFRCKRGRGLAIQSSLPTRCSLQATSGRQA